MPWKLTANLTDAEIEALWNYLRSGNYAAQAGGPKS